MSQVTFKVALIAANLEAISNIATIIAGLTNEEVVAPTNEEVIDAEVVEEVVAPTNEEVVEEEQEDKPLTLAEFKAIVKKAKAKHGEEFVTNVIEASGTKALSTLGRTVSKIPTDKYDAVSVVLGGGPEALDDMGEAANEDDQEFLDDLDADLGDDTTEVAVPDVDPEAVKIAVKAFAKENGRNDARELLGKYKCKALADVDGLDNATLAKLLADTVL